ncbi:NEDD8 activating enzyme [Coemansia erecta]|uniref:NEDD8-activating enzyme E1 catalytic subunit n=1 Tax=Coemansia erecta TaxID=147472 RepID=A0A9W7XYZ8_9FUNG|nr:NEDD8 activating enzyme [Coemansia erecta]
MPSKVCHRGIQRFLQLKAPHVENFELVNDEGKTPQQLLSEAKVLVIGAGGLGCEILKNLAMSGFKDIHVIDMDTIDISNLNRQFLFRKADVGKPKAEVAAEFIRRRSPEVSVTAHFKRIQEMSEEFYLSFTLIVCGLDSIEARRWINAFVCGLVETHGFEGFKPIVDGGTEGFKGNARLILPTHSACFECGLSMFPPKTTYPICTIANTPRLPEHCIEWASVLEWPRVFPEKKLDGDDPDHINWLVEQATQRAAPFNITGITYSLTQGVVKNIIPAIASTNAIIAAACTNEAFKIVTSSNPFLDNYIFYSGDEGIHSLTFPLEKNPDCLVCGNRQGSVTMSGDSTLEELIDELKTNAAFQLKAPTLTVDSTNLYFQNPKELEELTRPNLEKKLSELFDSESTLTVTDTTLPTSLQVTVTFS